ncbi:MAG: prepilin peptidase [Pseudomonadota bacterium]
MLNAVEAVLICLVMQAAVTDLTLRKIPNVLVLCGLPLALVLHMVVQPDWAALWTWLLGLLVGFLLFLPLYLLRGMAAGDVKLMAMVGAFAGPAGALQIGMATFIIGGVMGLALMAVNGRLRQGLYNLHAMLWPLLLRLLGVPLQPVLLAPGASVGGMPYGVAIACGTLTSIAAAHYPF